MYSDTVVYDKHKSDNPLLLQRKFIVKQSEEIVRKIRFLNSYIELSFVSVAVSLEHLVLPSSGKARSQIRWVRQMGLVFIRVSSNVPNINGYSYFFKILCF
jgi:hypothetical protein